MAPGARPVHLRHLDSGRKTAAGRRWWLRSAFWAGPIDLGAASGLSHPPL